MSECVHMIGLDFYYYEGYEPIWKGAWNDKSRFAEDYLWFNFCPICGEPVETKEAQ